MGWSISENLEPVYHDDPRESLSSYVLVDTETGTILGNPRTVRFLHRDHFDGDQLEEMSDSEISEYAERHGMPLTDDFVN